MAKAGMAGRKTKAAAKPAGKPVKKVKAANGAARAKEAFDIKAEHLPDAIREAAFHSGNYPHDEPLKRKLYDRQIEPLQIELLKMLAWVKARGERLVIVFEGRDAAGKGGTIGRFTQHLNPRFARIVALGKPSDAESGHWYFQRYASQMPTRGEIVFFDRSWYNRAGVEPVMGFCEPEQTDAFLREAPAFEGMLARDGIRIVKLFLTIGREMQMKRLHARFHDPLKRWKLSPIDFDAMSRFDAYSDAFEQMLARTSTDWAPWTVIRANDKLRTRLNAIRHVLTAVPYDEKDEGIIGRIDDEIVLDAAAYLDAGGER
jgi:polyphosphate kinase 2